MATIPETIKAEPNLPGWSVVANTVRERFISKGYVLNKNHRIYRDNSSDEAVYKNDLFSDWQNTLAASMHNGHHVIVDVATSCGKTWATNMITAHEVLSDPKATALIVTPNSEVMREVIRDISVQYIKYYTYDNHKMIDTLTHGYCTFDENKGTNAQILTLGCENVVEFMTKSVNERFIKNLRFLIFDETHLPSVATSFWWSQFLPQTAQIVLLSATLGNIEYIHDLIAKMDTKRQIDTICYNVRPIPLQYVVNKGLDDLPQTEFINSEYKSKGRVGLLINPADPTPRDIRAMKPGTVVPNTRDDQYRLGQEVVAATNTYLEKNETILTQAAAIPTDVGDVYKILSYLFSNGMDPVMVFHTSPESTHQFGEKLAAHISELERNDPQIIDVQRTIDRYHDEQYRHRDDKVNEKVAGSIKAEKAKNSFDKAPAETRSNAIDITHLEKQLLKWRIPHADVNPDLSSWQQAPQWIRDCLRYGIGVYVADLPTWLKHHIFDSFNEGKLKLLLADSSISVGINLPIRTCVLMGDDITHTLFKQAGGRAGRRGFDDQGYVMSLFETDTIRKYISEKPDPVQVQVPKRMTYAQLIRLTIPSNLDRYSGKFDKKTKKLVITNEFVDTRGDIDSLKKAILKKYKATLVDDELERFSSQIEHINLHGYNYHCLTNLFKKLPEDNSILIFHLILNGYVQKFSMREFVDMMSFLLFRIPDESGTVPIIQDERLTTALQDLAIKLNLDLDLSVPVSTYFTDFIIKGQLDPSKVDTIKTMGNWLYIFKEEVDMVAPADDRIMSLLKQVEYQYQSACTTKYLSEKKKSHPQKSRPKIRI